MQFVIFFIDEQLLTETYYLHQMQNLPFYYLKFLSLSAEIKSFSHRSLTVEPVDMWCMMHQLMIASIHTALFIFLTSDRMTQLTTPQ